MMLMPSHLHIDKHIQSVMRDWVLLATIIIVGVSINGKAFEQSGLWWTDESRHAMHGVFFLDFVRDLPLQAPLDYVQRYFAQYPALAFNWYLPVFPVFMALFMYIFGASEASAHTTVTAFWFAGTLAWYFWLAPRFGRLTAFTASLALLSMPVVVLWSRSVMLEAPAVGMCAISVYFFQRYLDKPAHSRAIIAGLVLFVTILIKQTNLFILPVLLVYALSSPEGRNALRRREAVWGLILALLAVSLVALHALFFGPSVALSSDAPIKSGAAPLASLQRWVLYSISLYHGMGPVMAVLAVMGLALSFWRRSMPALLLPLAWLLFSYVWCTYLAGIPGNSERYAFYAMPPVALFASYGVYALKERPKWIWLSFFSAAIGLNYIDAIAKPHRFVSGYAEAAKLIASLPNNGTILVAGKHDGNFIFHMRLFDKDRQRVILRGDKLLVEMSVHKFHGVRSHVSNPADIRKILDKNGVRWIVLESRDLVGLDQFKMLQAMMGAPEFRPLARIPLETNLPEFHGTDIVIYENLSLKMPPGGRLRITYPYLGKSYEFSFRP